MNWLNTAKQLPLCHTKRIAHCGTSKAAVIYHKRESYQMYCHKCKGTWYKEKGDLTALELRTLRKEQNKADTGLYNLEVPNDLVPIFEASPKGITWLLKAGISLELADLYSIGWLESSKRVFLPVYYKDKHQLLYFQARAVETTQDIKYINPRIFKDKLFFKSKLHLDNSVVITEDILSAIRVGEVTNAWSPMGTNLSLAQAAELSKNFDTAYIWLDPDKAGVIGAKKMYAILTLLMDTHIISSPKDPKNHTKEEIITILGK